MKQNRGKIIEEKLKELRGQGVRSVVCVGDNVTKNDRQEVVGGGETLELGAEVLSDGRSQWSK